jgi:hypothetical protein
MVPPSLFSSKIPDNEKRCLADKLLSFTQDNRKTVALATQQKFGTGFGKPNFPQNVSQSSTLADLAGLASWFTLRALDMQPSFLNEDVTNWSQSAACQQSLDNVHAVNVVNDAAQRGIKISSDFLQSAKTEHHYQSILQVVEQDHKHHTDLRKRKIQIKHETN